MDFSIRAAGGSHASMRVRWVFQLEVQGKSGFIESEVGFLARAAVSDQAVVRVRWVFVRAAGDSQTSERARWVFQFKLQDTVRLSLE